MDDYISRQWLLNEYDKRHKGPPGGAREMIEEAPAADVRPVERGTWEQREVFDARGNVYELQSAFCPVCKRYHTTPYLYSFTHYDYCPNCGAKMDEIEKSIDAHAKRGRCGRADMTGGEQNG